MVGNIGILYEDPYILVCRKPAGVPVQSANSRVKDMVSILKLYLLEESGKPGEPYLGVVHRLDQQVFDGIRKAMEEAVEMSQDKKDLDDEIVGRVNHLNESILSLEEDLGHKVSMSELSAYLEMPLEEIKDVLRMAGDEMKDKSDVR